MANTEREVTQLLEEFHNTIKSLEGQYGLVLSASGKVEKKIPDEFTVPPPASEMGEGKQIRWKGNCPAPLHGFDAIKAAKAGYELPPEVDLPHPASYDSQGRRCVASGAERASRKSAREARAKSAAASPSAHPIVRQTRNISALCGALLAKLQSIGNADIYCDDVNVEFGEGPGREAFCESLRSIDGASRCQFADGKCATKN